MVAPDVLRAVAQVDAALDALARIDVTGLGDDDLDTYVGELQRLSSRFASVRSALKEHNRRKNKPPPPDDTS